MTLSFAWFFSHAIDDDGGDRQRHCVVQAAPLASDHPFDVFHLRQQIDWRYDVAGH